VGIFRSIFTVAHVVIVLLLGATMLNAYIPPKVFPFLNLLSLAFPFLMIANLLLCVFWIFSWRKRAFVFLLISTLFLTPVRRWINYSEPKSEKADFKVLSFNNKVNEFGKEHVENYINSFDADFVFLQEAGYSNLGNPILEQMKYSFHHPIISFYSKYEIIEKGSIPFEVEEDLYERKSNAMGFLGCCQYLHICSGINLYFLVCKWRTRNS
jgi:hypothetical protein